MIRMARFWKHVDRANECWPWLGRVDRKGYGRTDLFGEHNGFAHRLAYKLLVGEIPDGMEFDHTCHTTALAAGLCSGGACAHRRCVNPAHLEPVTHRENILRGDSFAANFARQDLCKRGHELVQMGDRRRCPTCRTTAMAKWVAAHRKPPRARILKPVKVRIPTPAQTHCKNGHPLAPPNIYVWHNMRQCIECRRVRQTAWAREYRLKKRQGAA